MSRGLKIVLLFSLLSIALISMGWIIVAGLQDKMRHRLEQGWVLPPLELYTQGLSLTPGRKLNLEVLDRELRKRELAPQRDYVIGTASDVAQSAGIELKAPAERAFWLRAPALLVAWDNDTWITEVWSGDPLQPRTREHLFPRLITQFYGDQPILQANTGLAEVPLACLQAVTAIEDRDFLEHKGVSATGTARALMRNLRAGRFKEGGSTITQQLVKNFFLNAKKTLRRKLEEQVLAIMLEAQLSKDQILEMYLNVIYMGQSGPYQVRGIGAAAQHYFDKSISQLTLSDCALLAALINSPGRYSPFDQPDNARTRRELVLTKMKEEGMINEAEWSQASAAALPNANVRGPRSVAPYFVLTALKQFQSLELDTEDGARIYTTLNDDVQNALVQTIQTVLPEIERKVKKPSPQPLQTAMLTVDVNDGSILALAGGRDFRSTQYNRAVDSRRQVGSIVKPFVFLAALNGRDPLSEVLDEPFEWKSGKTIWRPKDYDGKPIGPVPLFYALAHSLNLPAARLGQEIGVEHVVQLIRDSGIRSEPPALPSLTLGAFEASPMDMAQGYTTLAHLGEYTPLHAIDRIETPDGQRLWSSEEETTISRALNEMSTAVLLGMMRQSAELGTARAIKASGIEGVWFGKTGTTSETLDAWFAGFDGRLLTVVWVGYDDNTPMGLTGASGALPLWIEQTKRLSAFYRNSEPLWPTGIEKRRVPREHLLEKFPRLKDLPENVELIFKSWAS